MKALGKQIYRFDGIELNGFQGNLRRDGEELSVRQKSLQVLLYLVEQRHRLVTKEELIERVWDGMAVTDDALVQLIKELRRSLADDPRHPRFIKTVPRAGYRFIAPVEEFHFDLPVAVELERHATVEIEFEEEITETSTDRETGRDEATTQRRLRRQSRSLLLFAIFAGLLLVAGALATYTTRRNLHSGANLGEVTLPQLPGKKALAVIYFDNQSASADLDWLREGLADMLITNLSRSRKLTVLGRQQLHVLLERMDHRQTDVIELNDAVEIGRKSQAEVIVLGSFARLEDRIRINVQLYNAETAQPFASESIVADKPGDILTQIDLLSLKLAMHLGASPDDRDAGTPLAGAMTDNLDAYRYYSLALETAQAYHTAEAIELWEKAIRLDPGFAMAYARIGYTYVFIRVNELQKAKPYLEKALQLSYRLTDKDKLYIKAWYALANVDVENGIRLLREIISEYPNEVDAYLRLGYQLDHVERGEEAIAVWKQVLLFDPEARDILNALGFAYWRFGRYDEAIAAHRSYVQLMPNEPNAHDSLGMTYIEAGRYDEAQSEFGRALALNPDFHFARLHLGDVYFRLGRYAEATTEYRRYIELAPSDWDGATGYHRLALLYLEKGDLQKAEAAANRELKHKNNLGGRFLVALANGDLQTAEKFKGQIFESTRPPHLSWKTIHYFRGCRAIKSGHASEAIEHFKEALNRLPLVWTVGGVEDCLANAYLELDKLDEAITEYERILSINPSYPLAHFHLAQAYERRGDIERARSEYQKFLAIWKNADPKLSEVIIAKQRLSS